MNFRLSDLKIDKVLGVDFINETTNQVVGHWSYLETLPKEEEEVLVEVKQKQEHIMNLSLSYSIKYLNKHVPIMIK